MKLLLTLAEAQTAIRRSLNLPSDVQVIIGRKPKSVAGKVDDFNSISPALGRLIRYIDANVVDNKIPAIKELRAQATLMNGGAFFGLKEAKDIVENWSKARVTFFQKGRVTNPVYENCSVVGFN